MSPEQPAVAVVEKSIGPIEVELTEVAIPEASQRVLKSYEADMKELQAQLESKFSAFIEFVMFLRKDLNVPETWPVIAGFEKFVKPEEKSKLIVPDNAGKVVLA